MCVLAYVKAFSQSLLQSLNELMRQQASVMSDNDNGSVCEERKAGGNCGVKIICHPKPMGRRPLTG